MYFASLGEAIATSPAAQDGASLGDPKCNELFFNGLTWLFNSIDQARL